MKKFYLLNLLLCAVFWNSSVSQNTDNTTIDSLKIISSIISDQVNKYHYDQAIEQSHSLREIAEKSENFYFISKSYNYLGNIYDNQNDKARARKNYALSLEYAKLSRNDTLLMHAFNNLGNIYSEIPETREKGIAYYNRVIDLATRIGAKEELIAPKTNIGWTYLDIGEYEKAYPYLNQSLKLMDSLKAHKPQVFKDIAYFYPPIYMLHGRYYSGKKDFNTSSEFFTKAIKLAERDSMIFQAKEAYFEFSKMLAEKGDYREAYEAQEKFLLYNSNVFEAEKLKQMEIANARYNLDQYKKDLLISEKEQEYQHEIIQKSKEKVVVMVFSSVGMIFILVFLYKVNRDRQRLIEKLKVKNLQYRDAKIDAERLSSLKTKFFSTVSHEIRTPLYGVIGLTSLLLEDKSLDKHKGDLKSLKFSADYLLALINDVLQMNKMESNEVKLENVPFSLQDLMKSIVNSFEFTRVQNKNNIVLDIDSEIPASLIGDSVRLSQILMNLVGNAIKFTERGNIWIQARQQERTNEYSEIYFEIKDDGPGIPESKKKVIFEEFSQLENSNYNYQGTGLGLPIVKRMLKLFNSKIKLESKEGEGSAFSFTISFKVDESKNIETTGVEETSSTLNYGNKRILIVDDNRINQVVTKRILEKKDFECEVAGDGTTAIQIVRENHFDLILMDVNMPGISGLDASKEIRKFNDKIPILALTAVEVEEIREEIKTAGMSDIIIKPYDVQQFYQIVFKNLSISRKIEKV